MFSFLQEKARSHGRCSRLCGGAEEVDIAGTFLEEALRDRVVCGIHNIAAQKPLLSEKDFK